MLFLVPACGARTWKLPQGTSRHLLTPAEAAFQPPEGQAKLYMDGPWRLQWPCLIPWALMQAAVTVTWLRNATASGQPCTKKRKEKKGKKNTTPFDVNLMRSQVLHWAAQI